MQVITDQSKHQSKHRPQSNRPDPATSSRSGAEGSCSLLWSHSGLDRILRLTLAHLIQVSRSFPTTIKQASDTSQTARSMPCAWHAERHFAEGPHLPRTEGGGQQRLCQGLRLPVHQLGQRLSLYVQARHHELPREAASPLRLSPDAAGDDVDCASSLRLIL